MSGPPLVVWGEGKPPQCKEDEIPQRVQPNTEVLLEINVEHKHTLL